MATEDGSKRQRRIDSEPSSPPITKLGDDVLVEILIRLPNPRSAGRCKPVCKRWSSLIFTRRFNRRFVSHRRSTNGDGKKTPLILSGSWCYSLSFLPVDSHLRLYFRIHDSFRDLMLCGFQASSPAAELRRTFLVCNPFTKQWIALPLSPELGDYYRPSVARLVCEPRIPIKNDVADYYDSVVAYSEIRFRVVRMYKSGQFVKLDVFCSESGKWSETAVVLDDMFKDLTDAAVVSCNGKLYWQPYRNNKIVALDPFHLNTPAAEYVDVCEHLSSKKELNILSVSQGFLHVIATETEGRSRFRASVWRLDGKSWTKQCESILRKSGGCNYHFREFVGRQIHGLHPQYPKIVFFKDYVLLNGPGLYYYICSADLRRRGKFDCLPGLRQYSSNWAPLFQPKFCYWPTPIPKYHKFRDMYNGN